MKKMALLTCFLLNGALFAEEEAHEFHWTKEKSEFANIVVQKAGPGTIQNCVHTSAKIVTHPDYLAYVFPKITGCTVKVLKNMGDTVEKDEVLALLESHEIAEAKAHYLTAKKQLNVASTLFEQEKILKGISSRADYLNAELRFEEALIQLELTRQNLLSLGFNTQEIGQIDKKGLSELRFYEIKAPIAGKILERDLTLGEVADHETKAFTIGNIEKVCVVMNISQNDVQHLKEGNPVEISSGDKKMKAHICQLNPSINEDTRMACAVALMDNSSQKWSPGEFVTARVQTSKIQVPLIVPISSLQTIEGKPCVFVENGDEFVPCRVVLGKMDYDNVEIVSGLSEGIVFAAQNTFILKAEYEKDEAHE